MKSRIIEVRGRELEVFENGVVYSAPFTDTLGRKRRRFKRNPTMDGGYFRICVYGDDGVRLPTAIHRLVAQAFLPEWREDWDVDHIDMDKTNNNAYNLRMMSRRDHIKSHTGRYGRRLPTVGTGSLKWVDGIDGVYYEKALDGYAYLFKHEGGMAYGGYFETADQAKESCKERKQELG